MGEIEWNVGWKNGKSGVGWMPDDTIKNQRPGKCEDAYGNACHILCSKSSRALKKRSAYTSCRSSSMRLMIGGERRNHTLSGEGEAECGIRNAEFGIKDGATVPHTVARREAPLSEYGGRSYRSAIYAAQLPRPLRFMAGAANEALRI